MRSLAGAPNSFRQRLRQAGQFGRVQARAAVLMEPVNQFQQPEGLARRVWRGSLLALPAAPDVAAPAALSENGAAEFRNFLALPGHKAFAMTQSGAHYGFAYARRTEKEAAKMAEEHCKEGAGSHDPCTVVVVDERKNEN